MLITRNILALLLVLPLFFACNRAEQEPVYLQLNGINFTTVNGEGAATQDITSVWVFIDNDFFGAYRPDARVVLLETGAQDVRFEFGVQENGRAATPNIYDFYQPVTLSLDLIPGETLELPTLDVSYKNEVVFAFVEGFENLEERVFIDIVTGATTLEPTTDVVRSGQFSGVIELTNMEPTFEAISARSYEDLVGQIGQVWLEVDYLSDIPVIWGIASLSANQELLRFYDPGFVPRSEWTKIYFNLTQTIVSSRQLEYNFGLTAFINDLNTASGTVYLDNIKVLYF